LLTCAIGSFGANAKEAARIGVLGSGSEDSPVSRNQMNWFRNGLRAAGLKEGQDYVFDVRWANAEYHRFPTLAAEIISGGSKVIIVSTIAAAEAARDLSRTIPIVMAGLNDPVGAKLVNNLARPGGNITGVATLNEAMVFKLLELLPSVLPNAKRIAIILNPTNPSNPTLLDPILAEASRVGCTVVPVEVATPAALQRAFDEIRLSKADVLMIAPDNALISISQQIVALAVEQRLPVISTSVETAQAGGLLSYGYVRRELLERAGLYVAKILLGANPAALPVEQPTIFHMVVNLRTARSLGIEVDPALLARADDVIE
jgi:putative ABC transport system substrate-binding protein